MMIFMIAHLFLLHRQSHQMVKICNLLIIIKYLLNNLTYNKYTISAKGPLSLPYKEILDESNGSNSFTGKISHQPVLLTNKETGEKK